MKATCSSENSVDFQTDYTALYSRIQETLWYIAWPILLNYISVFIYRFYFQEEYLIAGLQKYNLNVLAIQ
jgi:hypothetical protein